MVQRVAILGSTGSIGTQSLEVIENHRDKFDVCALTAGSNISLLEKQVRLFKPEVVAVTNEDKAGELKQRLNDLNVDILVGDEGLKIVAAWPGTDVVIVAVVGFSGVEPTLAAIREGKKIALANKETLVVAGEIVMTEAQRFNAVILPIDSEHNAIFQCLHAGKQHQLQQIILTASGGPFLGKKKDELEYVTPEQALRHPNWQMGPRITIDSATLMNKGFEVIEACHLFNLNPSEVKVIIHPESIIHSMVEFNDGSIIAQLGLPDMKLPIQYVLSYPDRWPNTFPPFDWKQYHKLHFIPVEQGEFPCLKLAFEALETGGTLPAVLNGADEVVVQNFLKGRITFLQIPDLLEEIMGRHQVIHQPSLEDIINADRWAREQAEALIT